MYDLTFSADKLPPRIVDKKVQVNVLMDRWTLSPNIDLNEAKQLYARRRADPPLENQKYMKAMATLFGAIKRPGVKHEDLGIVPDKDVVDPDAEYVPGKALVIVDDGGVK